MAITISACAQIPSPGRTCCTKDQQLATRSVKWNTACDKCQQCHEWGQQLRNRTYSQLLFSCLLRRCGRPRCEAKRSPCTRHGPASCTWGRTFPRCTSCSVCRTWTPPMCCCCPAAQVCGRTRGCLRARVEGRPPKIPVEALAVQHVGTGMDELRRTAYEAACKVEESACKIRTGKRVKVRMKLRIWGAHERIYYIHI